MGRLLASLRLIATLVENAFYAFDGEGTHDNAADFVAWHRR
jgi:hypothetical protein